MRSKHIRPKPSVLLCSFCKFQFQIGYAIPLGNTNVLKDPINYKEMVKCYEMAIKFSDGKSISTITCYFSAVRWCFSCKVRMEEQVFDIAEVVKHLVRETGLEEELERHSLDIFHNSSSQIRYWTSIECLDLTFPVAVTAGMSYT